MKKITYFRSMTEQRRSVVNVCVMVMKSEATVMRLELMISRNTAMDLYVNHLDKHLSKFKNCSLLIIIHMRCIFCFLIS